MSEEPEVQSEEIPEADSFAVRVEVDVEKAVEVVKREASSIESLVHAAINTFWADVVTNVTSKIPTELHNTLHSLKEDLRARLLSLLSPAPHE
jgi:hypothetical protein